MTITDWLTDPTHWSGPAGVPAQTLTHLRYSAAALAVAVAIGLPLGLYVGHTGRGRLLVAGTANALRALPSLGLLVLAVMLVSPLISSRMAYVIPSTLVLVLLAVPPILTNTYAGVQAVDEAAVDAALAMGYTRPQVLLHVQVPGALPLIMSGIRSSTLQVVSTATIAAFVSLGGLGRYILDGRATRNYAEMASGALLVAALAIVLELVLIALTRAVVSPGLTRTQRRSPRAAVLAEPPTH